MEPGRPEGLLAKVRDADRGGDIDLAGGPRTIETIRRLGALDFFDVIVVPSLVGGGMQLTPALGPDVQPTLESERRSPAGTVELVYACG